MHDKVLGHMMFPYDCISYMTESSVLSLYVQSAISDIILYPWVILSRAKFNYAQF